MSRAQLTSTVEQNTGGAVAPFVAGKNKIINGDFGIWQRGTSFTNPSSGTYTADRWTQNGDGSGYTRVFSQQTFTPGSAPVAGYEFAYYYQFAQTVAGSGGTYCNFAIQRIEDARTFAGQTVTLSFWAKGDAARTFIPYFNQTFGSGGSTAVFTAFSAVTVTTSWARYSVSITLPSVAGKTIVTSSFNELGFSTNAQNITQTISLWGVQVEAGSVATPFTTASGTVQGELALCQRYYAIGDGRQGFSGNVTNGSTYSYFATFPVSARTSTPTVTLTSIGSSNFSGTGTVTSTGYNGFQVNLAANGTGSGYFINTYTMSNEL